ncbi:putative protein TPRXL [Phoenix dactylifera]|uniref:VQ domain-containing protein n=1 Tax=Phoenix dactylifera TaxID=42345 RepID=A0A8B8J180_PHODC|nr:putative protein TPRXL [Phoenix dactylifera]
MDSSNSGSIQSSSSGGDDDYDSRTEAISSFLNLPPPAAPPPLSPSHHLHQHPSPSSFISLSPYLNTFPSTPSDPYPLSLDMAWAKSLPSSSLSEPGCTILGGLTTATSSSSTTTTTSSSSKTMAVGAPSHCLHSGNTSLNPSSVQLQTQPAQPAAAPRGSKKRSRASRRAPTTVLTTDTSNFRAMVQEFTGFPAAPFISSPFSRPRLDLFPAAAAAAAPPYLLRPFPQKVQAPLFAPLSSSPSSSPSSSVAASIARSSTANANTGAPSATCSNSSSSSTTSSSNYQWPSIGLRHPNLLNTQSPNFTFQSPSNLHLLPITTHPPCPPLEALQTSPPGV